MLIVRFYRNDAKACVHIQELDFVRFAIPIVGCWAIRNSHSYQCATGEFFQIVVARHVAVLAARLPIVPGDENTAICECQAKLFFIVAFVVQEPD
jgi:hypothetical protein